jgi:hypothetical protein
MATNTRTTDPQTEIAAARRAIGELKQGSHAAGLRGNTRDQFRCRREIARLQKRIDALTAIVSRSTYTH